jgi:dTDP-4-dehydrorhamnose reductase
MTPLLIVGAGGQLGDDLVRAFADLAPVALTRDDLDITDGDGVAGEFARIAPATVLNAAAYNRVDDAERDPAPAFAANAVGAHHLASAAARLGARLVHLSTDYVFGGAGGGPFTEDEPPAPLNAYGVSKLAGEQLVRAASPRHLVVRTCGLYGLAGSRGKGGNFVETMLRLAREGKPIRVVDDQVVTPTYTLDLAQAIRRLLGIDPPGGVYHLTNAGACSWFEFARAIFAGVGLRPDLAPTTSAALAAPARRAANSVLRDTRLAALGVQPLRPWPEALRAYLAARPSVGASSCRAGPDALLQ